MTYAKTTIIAAFASVCLALSGSNAQADTYDHIDELALRMQRQSRELLNEFAAHYRHKPQYQHLRSDAIQLYRVASHIHEVAHHHGSPYHLANDLRRADQLFHHLEEVVEHVEHSFGGHVHGHTGHVRGLMRQMERTIHHLRSDVESLTHYGHGHGHGHGHGPGIPYRKGVGINVNGKGWSIRLGG